MLRITYKTYSGINASLRNRTVGRRRRRAKHVCDKRDRAITCVFCGDLHLTPMFCGPKKDQKDKKICEGKLNLAKNLFQAKLLSRLSHKVCSLLASLVLLRKFTNV